MSVLRWAGAFLRSRQDLALEILALRQQVLVLKGKNPRPTWGGVGTTPKMPFLCDCGAILRVTIICKPHRRPCLECAVRRGCTREAPGGRAELATQGGMTRGSKQTDPKPENADKRIQSETESDRLLATDSGFGDTHHLCACPANNPQRFPSRKRPYPLETESDTHVQLPEHAGLDSLRSP